MSTSPTASSSQLDLPFPTASQSETQFESSSSEMMSSDLQEALSVRYVKGRWIVPLRSGRIALFDHPMGSLIGIFDTAEEALKVPVQRYVDPPRLTSMDDVVVDLDLSDLDDL